MCCFHFLAVCFQLIYTIFGNLFFFRRSFSSSRRRSSSFFNNISRRSRSVFFFFMRSMRRIFSGISFSVGGHRLLVPFNLGCSCTNLSRRFNFSASLLLLTISSNELRTFSVTSRRTLATESSCIMALNAGTSLSVKPVSRFRFFLLSSIWPWTRSGAATVRKPL